MNIYQSNTYKKDLSWQHSDDEPRAQERQEVKDQESCIYVFIAYTFCRNYDHQPPAQTQQQYSMHRSMADLKRYRETSEERNFIEQIKAPIFFEAVLATDNVRAPIQFTRKRQPQHLKG